MVYQKVIFTGSVMPAPVRRLFAFFTSGSPKVSKKLVVCPAIPFGIMEYRGSAVPR